MDSELLIHGGDVIGPHEVIRGADLLIRNRKIVRIARGIRRPSTACRVINARRGFVAPGLIDLQVNGAAGVMFGACHADEVPRVSRCLAAHGVTGYCPTIITMPHDRTLQGIQALVEMDRTTRIWRQPADAAPGGSRRRADRPMPSPAPRANGAGARILGIHLEGPYLSPDRHGAHRLECLRKPSRHEINEYLAAGRGLIALVTLAPELAGSIDLIRHLVAKDVRVAAGHSMATMTEMEDAMKTGLRMATHFYNAMRPFHHRGPGIIEAGLTIDDLSVGLIADGVHVHPAAVDIVLRCKPDGRVILVSDLAPVADAPDGRVTLDDRTIVAHGGAALLAGTTILSGSSTFLLEGVCNLVAWFDLPLPRAFRAASYDPAALLGLARRKGSLEPGKDADVIVLDRNLRLQCTVVEGTVAYRAG
jgi:N-acetylglucosamine-6-phosphate deacetylase